MRRRSRLRTVLNLLERYTALVALVLTDPTRLEHLHPPLGRDCWHSMAGHRT